MSISIEAQASDTQRSDLIYVDLDGSLIRSDLLLESALAFLKQTPLRIFSLLVWLLKGKAYLKARLAEQFALDATRLPYHQELLAYLTEAARNGATLILATASNEKLARAVADHLQIFYAVIASDEQSNLKGPNKARAIAAHAGGEPFTYIGNDASDLEIWRQARHGVLVNADAGIARRARGLTNIRAEFARTGAGLRTYARAIRVHQWAKNFLVFIPLLTAHLWADVTKIGLALAAFLAYSLCASSIYLLNDLLDLAADRAHPRKRLRPIPAGNMPLGKALLGVPLLGAAGLALGAAVSLPFLAVLGGYMVITVAYSMRLKTYVLIDVITLAVLYTVRIIGGAVAVAVEPSFWLLGFSMFIFLSLALIKRCSELQVLSNNQRDAAHGRDYLTSDYSVMQTLGVASGFAAVTVFALFINSPSTADNYSRPEVLWLLCVTILYWIARMWVKTARGEMHDDPLIYATRDRGSHVMLLMSAAIVIAAL